VNSPIGKDDVAAGPFWIGVGQHALVHKGFCSYLVQFTRSLLRARPIPRPSFRPYQPR